MIKQPAEGPAQAQWIDKDGDLQILNGASVFQCLFLARAMGATWADCRTSDGDRRDFILRDGIWRLRDAEDVKAHRSPFREARRAQGQGHL
jgi:hypothetical protein